MAPTNYALWYNKPDGNALEIKAAPYPTAKGNEIVVQARAVAINPIDQVLQTSASKTAFGWLKYPIIAGNDVAGDVVEIGPDVTRFKKGDRITACVAGLSPQRQHFTEGAFQNYVVVLDNMASPIPPTASYEDAAVIPLAISTAACALFQKDYLALQYPTVPRAKATGETLLIWGGSTSVGIAAIQLAVAAGYEVLTTCSPKNFDLVKSLGASHVFDYRSKTVTQDILATLEGKTNAGAFALGFGSANACLSILCTCTGTKFIATGSVDVPDGAEGLSAVTAYVSSEATKWFKGKTRGISHKFVSGTDLAFNEVGKAVWEDFLPKALAEGSYKCAPEALVYGSGIEAIEGAIKKWREGVSAQKIVVTM